MVAYLTNDRCWLQTTAADSAAATFAASNRTTLTAATTTAAATTCRTLPCKEVCQGSWKN